MKKDVKDFDHLDSLLMLFGISFLIYLFYKQYLRVKAWAFHHPRPAALVLTLVIVVIILAVIGAIGFWVEKRKKQKVIDEVFDKKKDSLYIGLDEFKSAVNIDLSARKTHTQVIGAPGTGKTENGIFLFAVDDMRNGRGFILIDGKPEKSSLTKLTAYAKETGRLDDLKVLSLADLSISSTFNPLMGDSPAQVADRIMQAFAFDDEYYKSIQQTTVSTILSIFSTVKVVPTFKGLLEALKNPQSVLNMAEHTSNEDLIEWAKSYKSLSNEDREKRTSGLIAHLTPFALGEYSVLFNTDRPEIDINKALCKNEILYFQLPALSTRDFGKATGKFVLQCLANAIAHRHEVPDSDRKFFSAYLDDFSEYLYEGFLTILNKSRSADVGVTFAHQALGDIESLGENIANGIKTDSSLKIFMKCVDPDSADYCSRLVGTESDEKYTQRSTRGIFGHTETGDASVRVVETFLYHPQVFKNGLGVAEAVMVVPHKYGASHVRVKFRRLPDLLPIELPKRELPLPVGFPAKYKVEKGEKDTGTGNAFSTTTTNKEVKEV